MNLDYLRIKEYLDGFCLVKLLFPSIVFNLELMIFNDLLIYQTLFIKNYIYCNTYLINNIKHVFIIKLIFKLLKVIINFSKFF